MTLVRNFDSQRLTQTGLNRFTPCHWKSHPPLCPLTRPPSGHGYPSNNTSWSRIDPPTATASLERGAVGTNNLGAVDLGFGCGTSRSHPSRPVSVLTSCSQLRTMDLEAKHALSTIHFSMNTFPKINRLPPEVLALIPSFLTAYKDLVYTTHVCRHWRSTIIASPSLWSSPDNDAMHRDLVAVYMDRCGDTPLDVAFGSDFDKNTLFLDKIVLHSSHIRKIRIPCLPWYHIAEISDAFDAPLPLLRDVDLSIGYDASPPPFQRPFLEGATHLVSLHLSDYSMLPGTLLHFIIPTLTRLSLLFGDSRTPVVGEILEFLRTSPLIEDLCIHADTLLDASEENSTFPDRFQPVDLPHLRNIHFTWATPRSQHTLLAHIQYPSDCSVSMRVRSEGNVAQPPQDVFPKSWDAFPLQDLSSVTLRMKREQLSTECAVILKKPDGTSFSISHSQNVDIFVFLNGEGDLVREPNRDRDDNRVLSDAIALIRKLPLRWIRKFVLEDLKADEMSKPESFEIPPALVKLICSDLPNLTTLSFTRTCVSELFNMLSPPPPPPPTYLADLFDSDATPEPYTPCPTLEVLEMRHPAWTSSRHCREALALARARKHEKVPFKGVFLCSPSIPKSMALGMHSYVGNIDIQKCNGCE